MEAKHEFGVDHHLKNTTTITGTSFSQLLLADDDNEDDNALGLGVDQTYNNNNNNNNTNLTDYSPIFPIHIAPQMLCFGNYQNEEDLTNVLTPQKSVITNSSDSSSASSCNNTTIFNSFSKPDLKSLQKKRNGSGQEPVTKAGVGSQRPPKKTKADNPTSTGHAKRKEKLGERIAALQQLVSPFGKIQLQCFTRPWATSNFYKTKFKSFAPLTCNACLIHTTNLETEITMERK